MIMFVPVIISLIFIIYAIYEEYKSEKKIKEKNKKIGKCLICDTKSYLFNKVCEECFEKIKQDFINESNRSKKIEISTPTPTPTPNLSRKLYNLKYWSDFLMGKIVINCQTKEEIQCFLSHCKTKDLVLYLDNKITNKLFLTCQENTCFKCCNGKYILKGSIDYFEGRNVKIVPYQCILIYEVNDL